MILIEKLEDYKKIENILNKETYESMLPYIKENFELSKKYIIAEDYIWEKIMEYKWTLHLV